MNRLLKLYPREWRRHYGAEIEEVVSSQPKSIQLIVDLLGGAIDAHLKPQAFARRIEATEPNPPGGSDMLTRLKGSGSREPISRKDALVAGGMTIVAALVVSAIMVIGTEPLAKRSGLRCSRESWGSERSG